MSLLKEFREFAIKGNMIDLAVGVVIGSAFGKIVDSLVKNIVMPPLNLLTGKYGVNFNELSLKGSFELPVKDAAGNVTKDAAGNVIYKVQEVAYFNYGAFIQTIVDFFLIAVAIFAVVKIINEAKNRFESEKAVAPPAVTPEDVLLLREIRDELKNR